MVELDTLKILGITAEEGDEVEEDMDLGEEEGDEDEEDEDA